MTKMLQLMQTAVDPNVSQVERKQASDEFEGLAKQVFERLAKGVDSTVLANLQDNEAAAEALTYLLWKEFQRG